jgi:hypothetical protein
MGKLQDKANLTTEELSELQTYVDQLETEGRALGGTTHHDTHTFSHHSHHHTEVAEVRGILDQRGSNTPES